MFKFLKKLFSFRIKPLTLEQYVKNRLAKGDTNEQIRKDLLDDLDNGGPIFGDFKEAFKPTFENSVSRFKDAGALAEMGKSGKYIWSVCKGKKDPICPDCLERDNQIKTWEEWKKMGLPKTGKTRCKKDCKCVLLPAEIIPLSSSYNIL